MNFYKTLGLKNSRIDVADALRGLAVAGIILYHSVEHFNMYDGSIAHAYFISYLSFLNILSTTTAIAPSPVTLQAVPKLSIAI